MQCKIIKNHKRANITVFEVSVKIRPIVPKDPLIHRVELLVLCRNNPKSPAGRKCEQRRSKSKEPIVVKTLEIHSRDECDGEREGG
jgi:hypothetical protein